MKEKIILILLLSIGISNLYSKDILSRSFDIMPKSPMVSQFLRYDELPVSEYTGVANISIPIYHIEVDNVKVPLELKYHGAGIKVNQEASWVGLGWDLSIGSIIQIVNDRDDLATPLPGEPYERIYPDYLASSISLYGYAILPFPRSTLGGPHYYCGGFDDSDKLLAYYPIVEPREEHNFWISLYEHAMVNSKYNRYPRLFDDFYVDSEPDIFKVNILGTTLTFTLDFKTNDFVVLNKKGYKIVYTAGKTWIITNPNGEEYHFSTSSETQEDKNTTAPVGPAPPDRLRSKIWMLNTIITKNKKEITFGYSKSWSKHEIETITQNADYLLESSEPQYLIGYGGCGLSASAPYTNTLTTTTTSKEAQIYLTSISFPTGYIDFALTDREDIKDLKRLDNIKIFNNNSQRIGLTEFRYDGFLEKNGTSKRLKLMEIIKNSEKYTFLYNETLLPSANSFSQDYWGYYNGKNTNKHLIPNPVRLGYKDIKDYQGKSLDNGNNMSADLQFTQAGILKEITYPTGGKTQFVYELNQFSNYWIPDIDSLNNKISKGLGLRVKSIVYKDSNGKKLKETQYNYEGGKAITPIALTASFTKHFYDEQSGGMRLYKTYYRSLSVTANGFHEYNPLGSISGVGYDKVIRIELDENNKTLGKVESYFNNTPDQIAKSDQSGSNVISFISVPAFKVSSSPENGTSRQINYYDTNNKLVKKESFDYQNIKSKVLYGARASGYAKYIFYSEDGTQYAAGLRRTVSANSLTYYPIFDFESLLIKKEEIQYTDKGQTTAVETYKYNSNNLLFEKNTSGSRIPMHKVYLYPQDFQESIHKTMIKANILSPVVEEISKNINGDIIEKTRVNYTDDIAITNGLILPKSIESSYYKGAGSQTDLTFNKYDSYGNVLEYKSKDGINIIYIWSYKHNYPIIEVKNATRDEVYNAVKSIFNVFSVDILSTQDNPDETILKSGILQKTLPNAFVTTYTYSPLMGIATITDPLGLTTYYEYNMFGRLKSISDDSQNKNNEYTYSLTNQDKSPFSVNLLVNKSYLAESTVTFKAQTPDNYKDILYNWYFKDYSGNVITSKLNTKNNYFTTKLAKPGDFTLLCTAFDQSKMQTVNDSKLISVKPIPPKVISVSMEALNPNGYTTDGKPIFKKATSVTAKINLQLEGESNGLLFIWAYANPWGDGGGNTNPNLYEYTMELKMIGQHTFKCRIQDFFGNILTDLELAIEVQ